MKLIVISAALLVAWQAPGLATNVASRDARLTEAMLNFCTSIRKANAMGRSAQPESPMGQDIARDTDPGTSMTYRDVWFMAKGSGIPACDAMW